MKFTSSVSAALIAATSLSSFSLAAPLSSDDLVKRDPVAPIFPENVSTFDNRMGRISQWGTSLPYVSKASTNAGQDISVLANFVVPDIYADRQCEVVFDLAANRPGSYASPGAAASIYKSRMPATQWATNNGRDQEMGRLSVTSGATATTVYGQFKFPCSAATNGKSFPIEVVPTNEYCQIGWNAWVDGVKVNVLPK